MPKKLPIGHMTCPDCDFPDAEILNDKNGDPYRYCSDCGAQYFSRGDSKRKANLLKKMRAVAVTSPAQSTAAASQAAGGDVSSAAAPGKVTKGDSSTAAASSSVTKKKSSGLLID